MDKNTLAPLPSSGAPINEKFFKGLVIDINGKPIANTPLIIYAKPQAARGSKVEWDTAPIAFAKTDGIGNFQLKVSTDNYELAYVTVGKYTNQQINVTLESNMLPAQAILVLDISNKDHDGDGHDDCACHQHSGTDRLPEMEDLVGNTKYSQDIGGSCTNFTTPNRALEEFNYFRIVRTSDPEIITPENTQRLFNLDEAIRKLTREITALERDMYPQMARRATTSGSGGTTTKSGKVVPDKEPALTLLEGKQQNLDALEQEKRRLLQSLDTRKELSVRNMLDWDDSPTTYQNASIAYGHILEFRQVWRADGYSMGDLLYSLPLAPGQKRQIAVFDWDRKDTATRIEDQEQREELYNEQGRDRDISEIVSSVLNENQQATSTVKGKSSTWGVGASVSTPTPVSVGVSGSYSKTNSNMNSTSSQESSRDLSASSMQQIKDKTMQKASSVRSARSTVIQSVNQGESFNATTEVVANYNHCHAITIQYFEVLRHFAVNNELADVRECLFIPLPITSFDDSKVVRWQDILTRAIPDRTLRSFFPSVHRYYNANVLNQPDAYSGIPNTRYCDERINTLSLSLDLEMYVNRPQEILPPTIPTYSAFIASTLANGGANLFDVPNLHKAYEVEKINLLINHPADIANWQSTLGFVSGWQEIRRRVLTADVEKRDAVFQIEMHKADWMNQYIKYLHVYCHFPQQNNMKFPLSPTHRLRILSRKYNTDEATRAGKMGREITVGMHNVNVSSSPITRALFFQVEIVATDIAAPGKLPAGSFVRLRNGYLDYTSPNFRGYVFKNAQGLENIGNGEVMAIQTPLNDAEIYNPRVEDIKKRDALIKHLNSNLEAYHHWIFYMMSSDRRYMLLDGLCIKVPGDKIPGTNTYAPDEMRSVASVVENRVIGVVGNNMIVPVAAGYNLNPKFRWDNATVQLEDGSKVSALMNHYMPERGFKATPFRISVPTKGVFAEAVMGACNSCEKIDDSRFWKWEEHPTPDSPTAIGTIESGSRYQNAGNLTAKDFASALIAQKDALAAPDPTGLNTALNNITKGDSFRDLTNLQGLNDLAKQGMVTTSDAAKAYAANATKLAEQQANLQHGDSIANKIKNSGLPKEEKDKLMAEHIKKQIGVTEPNNTEQRQQDNTGKLIDKAVKGAGGKIKVTNADGSQVEADYGESNSTDINDEAEASSSPLEFISQGPSIIDETEDIDLNDPDFLAARAKIDQALADMQPDLLNYLNSLQGNNNVV